MLVQHETRSACRIDQTAGPPGRDRITVAQGEQDRMVARLAVAAASRFSTRYLNFSVTIEAIIHLPIDALGSAARPFADASVNAIPGQKEVPRAIAFQTSGWATSLIAKNVAAGMVLGTRPSAYGTLLILSVAAQTSAGSLHH